MILGLGKLGIESCCMTEFVWMSEMDSTPDSCRGVDSRFYLSLYDIHEIMKK